LLDWSLRSTQDLLRRADEMTMLIEEHGYPHFQAWVNLSRGWSLCALQRAEEGAEHIEESATVFLEPVSFLMAPLLQLGQAYSKMALNLPDAALHRLDEAASTIERTGIRWMECEVHRLRGGVLWSVGDVQAAESRVRQAISIAQQQGAKLWELRAASSLARLWQGQGKTAEARDLLAPVYGWFTEGFDTADLKEAKALLDELG
jgi:predicted ATPase